MNIQHQIVCLFVEYAIGFGIGFGAAIIIFALYRGHRNRGRTNSSSS